MRKAVIVLPTYNEAGSIEDITKRIFDATSNIPNWSVEILVVDSSSPDKTGEIVKRMQKTYKGLHLLETPKEGLGKAYMRGFEYATETIKTFVIFEMDADGQHDPKEIPNFLKQIEQGADFVIGSRYIKGGSIPKEWGIDRKFFSVFGNWIIRLGFMKQNIVTGKRVSQCFPVTILGASSRLHISSNVGSERLTIGSRGSSWKTSSPKFAGSSG